MTVRLTRWRRARAALLAVAVALIPVAGIASDGTPSPNRKSTDTSMRAALAREVAKMTTRRAVTRHEEQATGGNRVAGFLKSPPGMVALAVMVVGTGYAVYSTRHDKITSPGRK